MNRTVALLLLTAVPAAAKSYQLPRLPARVALLDDGSPFCASEPLRERLEAFAFGSVARGESEPDLTVRCAAHDARRALVSVEDWKGRVADSFKVKISPDPRHFEATGFLVARRLAGSRKVISPALKAYRANVRRAEGKAGEEDFASARWTDASRRLYAALESDAPAEPFYFGLHAAHARLGHEARARWYLLAFCAASGKRPDRLEKAQLAYLRELAPAPPQPWTPDALAELERLRGERLWASALEHLKGVVERAPWTVAAYDGIADIYETLKWDELEEPWRERGRIARRVNADKRLQESLLDALDR